MNTEEQEEKAKSLFEAETSGWLTTNPHTLGNIRLSLILFIRGRFDEDSLTRSVSHYYKTEHVQHIVNRLKRIAESCKQ